MAFTPIDELPWSIPVIAGHRYQLSLSPTATPVVRDPSDTSTADGMNIGPPITSAPTPEPPRVGRPHRGDRTKVKAARRARRAAR